MNRGYTANGRNQYSQIGSTITPSYDANGNMTSTGSGSYDYNAENRLTVGPGSVQLIDDGLDRLYRYYDGSADRWTLYDGQSPIAEYNNSGTVLRRFVHGPGMDEPIVWYEGSGTSDPRWLHADERGSVIAVSNGSGTVTNVNSYDEYGIPASANTGRFQYTGLPWLAELGMQYSRNRIYSPTMGRFMQTDPISVAGGINLYGYVLNDPVNFTDPLGLMCQEFTYYTHGWYHPNGEKLYDDLNSAVTHQTCSGGPSTFDGGPGSGGGEGGGEQNIVVTGRRIPDPPDDCPNGTSANTSGRPDYSGLASSYGRNRDGSPDQFAGQVTRSGDVMDPDAFTAASVRLRDSLGRPTRQQLIPNRSYVFVTSPQAPGRGATVYVNDTGPLRPGRIIDLSAAAMRHLTGNIVDLIPVNVYICR